MGAVEGPVAERIVAVFSGGRQGSGYLLSPRLILTAAHVIRGLFKGFGRNARLIKRTEEEADRLSVTLMANAGYDPHAAVRYWLTYGPRLNDGGGFGSTHQSWRERAASIAKEVDRVSRETARPIVPSWLSSRDQPLR